MNLMLQGEGNAIDFVKGVAKMGDVYPWPFAKRADASGDKPRRNFFRHLSVSRTQGKGQKIRCDERIQGSRGSETTEYVKNIGSGQLIHKTIQKMDERLVGDTMDKIKRFSIRMKSLSMPLSGDIQKDGITVQELLGFVPQQLFEAGCFRRCLEAPVRSDEKIYPRFYA
jgi:hypothetical protein